MDMTEVIAALVDTERARLDELRAIRVRLDELEGRQRTYTIRQFAEACNCSEGTVRTAIAAGRIRAVRLGPRTTVIPSSELERTTTTS